MSTRSLSSCCNLSVKAARFRFNSYATLIRGSVFTGTRVVGMPFQAWWFLLPNAGYARRCEEIGRAPVARHHSSLGTVTQLDPVADDIRATERKSDAREHIPEG